MYVMVYANTCLERIKSQVILSLLEYQIFFFSSFSGICPDRLFLDIHIISTSWL